MTYQDRYNTWLGSYFDETTRAELEDIQRNEVEIEDRFYKDLEFGTGGMRGVLGAGTNRINVYTIRRATQGLANFIIAQGGSDKGVAIAYDSRIMSPELAQETANCLVANGIRAYLFDDLRPTPELSFAVRELGCIAGVVITASHNPPEYNGYKVYWADGGQITPPIDKQIIASVNAITDYTTPLSMPAATISHCHCGHHCHCGLDPQSPRLLTYIGKEIDQRYYEEVEKEVQNSQLIRKHGGKLRIVYTPLHGAGAAPATHILADVGFTDVHVVKEQEQPDGHFPTIKSPNPEDKAAFAMALDLAKEVQADVVLATDPDGDRLGIYGYDEKQKEYVAFSGNMSAAIILEYLMEQKSANGTLPENGAVVTTIVSGKMGEAIAREYGMHLFKTLTGFKYIGQKIKEFEESGKYVYQFGYEESYGCLLGTYTRDKDAVVAVMALCEAALHYKTKGISLCEQMDRLYSKYGYYHEELGTVTLKGKDGLAKIQATMESIRANPPATIDGYQVVKVIDYGRVGETGLPKSNVVYFELSAEAWCCIRPSGTEPKIKFYIGVKGNDCQDANEQAKRLLTAVKKWV